MRVGGKLAAAGLLIALGLDGAAAREPRSFRDCTDCPALAVIPAGEGVIGSSAEALAAAQVSPRMAPREQPPRTVVFAEAFAAGLYPVTRGQFAAFVAATGHRPLAGCTVPAADGQGFRVEPSLSWRSPGFAQTDRHPVVCVSHTDASAYAAWLAAVTGKPYRLLSEAEWEYAARAGLAADRWWGAAAAAVCAHVNGQDRTRAALRPGIGGEDAVAPCEDGFAFTADVEAFPLNPWGVSMIGNVREWVADCWAETHAGAPATPAPRDTPPCTYRALKGSSFDYPVAHLRAPTRYRYPQETRYPNIGFRVGRAVSRDDPR
jgi:formylglycine-generating enzyme required for sulfatase activity